MTSQTITLDIPDRRPRSRWQLVTTWLIVINVAVFFVDQMAARGWGQYLLVTSVEGGGYKHVSPGVIPNGMQPDPASGVLLFPPIEFWGHFSAAMTIHSRQWWRLISFQFLHASTTHLLLNMVGLYMFGPLVEMYLGARRFLAFYLLCGAAGAVAYIGLWASHILVASPWTPLVGASAGIFGILIASARLAPNVMVMLLLPPIPMKLKTLVWVLIGLALFSIFFTGHNAGGEAAHLGGAIAGFLLITNPMVLDIFVSEDRRPKRKPVVYYPGGGRPSQG